ncbi:hypothetical protein [Ketobacter sp.]|uniref:hypothetical protein n=1 Tax=Ketobacter sp. TaxID=2083498 RepID=UPI000F1D634C|nr:hypothetical protein [Ketobacter sp.]RLU01271.1 MAG: hypothetical protein D9N14_02735 [Ketobacter sp.]
MAKAYVIRNQLGQYLTRKGEWVSGKDASVLFHQPHYDQALNQLIEINAKDIELRGTVVGVALDDSKRPQIQEYGPDPVQKELLQEEATTEDGVAA